MNPNKWVKQNETVNTVFFHRDFDFMGKEPRNKIHLNKKQFFIPDLVSMIDIRGRKVLFVGEISMGFDSKLILEKMLNHLLALGAGKTKEKYQHERGHFITWVFQEEALKRNTMKRMQDDKRFTNTEKLFLMKTTKELEVDFFHDWMIFTGTRKNFLPDGILKENES